MREPGEHRGRRAEATVQQQQRFENMFCVRVDYRIRQERERLSLLSPPKLAFAQTNGWELQWFTFVWPLEYQGT